MADEVDLAPQRIVPPGAGELGQLYAAVRNAFRSAGLATPDLDARLLVTETLRVTTAQLIANPRLAVSSATVEALNERAQLLVSPQDNKWPIKDPAREEHPPPLGRRLNLTNRYDLSKS